MKFESIKLHNFMRYKGETEIRFSCNNTKNVTVVLGDNAFGKTTLAQAFRWGLCNRQSRQRLDRHGTIVVGSCETFHHYNVQGVK